MRRFSIRRTNLVISFSLIVLIVTALWFVDVRDICAHSPHDPIDALELSPNYGQDQTLFIVISDHVFRSTDGGFSWKELVNGLDHTRILTAIAIAPSYQSEKTLFLSSDRDGIYRSQDGGDSWVKVDNGLSNLEIGSLSIHPDYRSEKVVLAAGTERGLYRTEDGGDSWHQVIEDSVRVTAMAFSPDLEKDCVLIGDHEGRLHLSTDGGENWQQILRIPNAGAIISIAVSPQFSSDGTFFVGTEKGGILRTVDDGGSFAAVNKGLRFTIRGKYFTLRKSNNGPIIRRDEKTIVSLAMSPEYENDSTVFAAMWNEAVFISDDGGDTWTRYPLGLTCDIQADSDEYKSSHFRDLRVSNNFAQDKTLFLGGFDGLFKSVDGGRRWTQMETLPVGLIKGLRLSPGSRDSLSVAITTYGGGAYITDDGATWLIGNKGLETTRLTDIVFSPCYSSDSTVFSGSSGRLLKSTDEGKNWETVDLGYRSWRTRIYSLLRKLRIPSFLRKQILTQAEREDPYPTALAISPNFELDHTLYFATRHHGIFKSVDGGRHASAVWDGMGRTITSLIISPDFPSDGTLFASVRGLGVYTTVDGGETWQPANSGLTFIEMWHSPTVHDITERDVQLVISPNYEADKTVFVASSQGLFKTTDGGAKWHRSEGSPYGKDGYIIGMAISPNYGNDETLIISVKGRGLFKTDDGGRTFVGVGTSLIDSNHAIELIEFSTSYATDGTIYAASDEDLFQSTDGGNTWDVIARPVRYENHREVVHYEGEWETSRGDDFSASTVSSSDVVHAKAALNFVGTGVSWIGTESDDQGIARVYIDGKHEGDVDQFGETRKPMVKSYSITGLAYGPHTIMVEVMGTKSPKSTGCRIEIDSFDIVP